jgi:hypothetical protein
MRSLRRTHILPGVGLYAAIFSALRVFVVEKADGSSAEKDIRVNPCRRQRVPLRRQEQTLFLAPAAMTHRYAYNIRPPWWAFLPPIIQAAGLPLLTRPSANEWPVFGLFVAITALSSWRLFSDERGYSLNKVWWLFNLIFLGLIPSLQLAVHTMPWHTGDISTGTMLRANGYILLCLGVFEIVRLWASRAFVPQPERKGPPIPEVLVNQFATITPAIMLCCGAALFIVTGSKGLYLRGYMEAALWQHSTSFQLLFDKILRGTMLWCCIAGIVLFRQHRLGRNTLLLILIPGLLFNFPLAMPRYMTLTVFLAWTLAAGFQSLRRGHRFSLLLLGLFIFIAPLFGVTRYAGIDMDQRLAAPRQLFEKAVLVTDYDAWSSLCRTMQYTAAQGSTGGRQLMGTILFFVPRSVWPAKPIGSGAWLFSQLGLDFKNVACTFLAEGYINFGFGGGILFTAVLALIIARFDGWYWQRNGQSAFRLPRLFYFVLIGMLFFILRGDLMSSVAYTIGLAVVFGFWQALFFWRLPNSRAFRAPRDA